MDEIPTFPPTSKTPPPLIVVAFLSILGGIVGTVVLFTLFPEYRLAQIPPGVDSVVVDRPGKVVIEEANRIEDLRNQASYQVGEIHRAEDVGQTPASYLWSKADVQGYVTILTSDGIFVTTVNTRVGDYVRIRTNNYRVTEVQNDPASALVFGKLSTVGLNSPALISHKDVRIGMNVVAVLADREVQKNNIQSLQTALNPTAADLYNSDQVQQGYGLARTTGLPGMPFFDMGGNLVGISLGKDVSAVVPAYVVATALSQTLQSGQPIARPSLGITYSTVSQLGGMHVVKAAGVAAKTLKTGDVITALNNQSVADDPNLLAAAILATKPADTIKLSIKRDQTTLDVDIVVSQL